MADLHWAQFQGCCRACKFPVVFLGSNGRMAEEEPYSRWDWWAYCSNPTCENHHGEGVWQDWPDWADREAVPQGSR